MLLGEYSHSLDTKGRIFIPVKFRSELSERVYLSRGKSKCIDIYSEKSWNEFYNKLIQLPLLKSEEARRAIFSGTAVVEPDGQGRILIPANLRAYAEIGKDAYVIGVGEKAEIWSKENWEPKSAESPATIWETLMELGL